MMLSLYVVHLHVCDVKLSSVSGLNVLLAYSYACVTLQTSFGDATANNNASSENAQNPARLESNSQDFVSNFCFEVFLCIKTLGVLRDKLQMLVANGFIIVLRVYFARCARVTGRTKTA